jgi:hypothetical protein
MKVHALVAMAALSLFACSKEGDKIIFHGDEAKQKTGEAAHEINKGAEKAAEKTEELGKKAWNGAKELGHETREEVKENPPVATPPSATGGGPTTDAGTK